MIYEVTFRGRLPHSLREAFEDLEVIPSEPTTTVRGDLPDQAALNGVLAQAQRLGLELLEVHRVEGTSP